jgi:co-chaperonin GroES (HSP10)
MKFHPLHDHVVVRRIEAQDKKRRPAASSFPIPSKKAATGRGPGTRQLRLANPVDGT